MDPNNNSADPETANFLRETEKLSRIIANAIPIGTPWPIAIQALRMTTMVYEEIMRSKVPTNHLEEWDNFTSQSNILFKQVIEEIGEELKK